MAVSMVISFWAGRRFTGFWQKLIFFFIASVVGIVLYPILGGLSVGFAYLGVVAISLFGAWVLPKMIAPKVILGH
jgi:hypothetical protein